MPLAALLQRKGWSQRQLADEAGLSRTDVTAMLRTNEKVLKVGYVRAERIVAAFNDPDLTVQDLGLPPEVADDEVHLSTAHRLAEVEALLERVLAALAQAGIALPDARQERGSAANAQRSRKRTAATGTDG